MMHMMYLCTRKLSQVRTCAMSRRARARTHTHTHKPPQTQAAERGEYTAAERLWCEMREQRVQPDMRTLNMLMR